MRLHLLAKMGGDVGRLLTRGGYSMHRIIQAHAAHFCRKFCHCQVQVGTCWGGKNCCSEAMKYGRQ